MRHHNKNGVEIFYKDWSTGQPMVFSHGWGAVSQGQLRDFDIRLRIADRSIFRIDLVGFSRYLHSCPLCRNIDRSLQPQVLSRFD